MTIDLTVRKKCQNMLFFLARIFPYENRICESVLITEDTGQKNPYSGIFYGVLVPNPPYTYSFLHSIQFFP